MHREILNKAQTGLLPFLNDFSGRFGIVGGTAIASVIGHRQSIDFDLFTCDKFNNLSIRNIITKRYRVERVIRDELGDYTILVNGVILTFFHFPFKLSFDQQFFRVIPMPNLLTLATMKAYALGRRAKWKDYVDLYFIIKHHFSISEIIAHAENIFGTEFNEKLFRSQLTYFEDIDYSEEVYYLPGFEHNQEDIRQSLSEFSLTFE